MEKVQEGYQMIDSRFISGGASTKHNLLFAICYLLFPVVQRLLNTLQNLDDPPGPRIRHIRLLQRLLTDIRRPPRLCLDTPRPVRRIHRSFDRTAEILPLGSGEVVRKCGERVDQCPTWRTGGGVLVEGS